MTGAHTGLHFYRASIALSERTSLSVVASMIQPGSTVLDLGTGSGALGKHLRENGGCTVDGVTINAKEARIAGPHYRRIEIADLEELEWAAKFAQNKYDCIVCADVLEHLRSPATALRACLSLLRPDGKILISVPNIAYGGFIADLLRGNFTYRDEGLLDRTHLRFFTRRSLLQFLEGEGWTAERIEPIERVLPESEFRVPFEQMPPSVARYLLALPDAATYQLVVAARPSLLQKVDALPIKSAPAQALFSSVLYLGRDYIFSETEKLVARGVVGLERQVLRFELFGNDKPLSGLRFDPADRPGFLYLHRITLRVGAAVIWAWSCDTEGLSKLEAAAHHDMVFRSASNGSVALVLLHGDDPSIVLPVPPDVLHACSGPLVVLEVELGWPMSADYMLLVDEVVTLKKQFEYSRLAAAETQRALAVSETARSEAERKCRDVEEMFRQAGHNLQEPRSSAALAIPVPKVQPMSDTVDVVVPVYRSLEDTRRCISSVLASQCATRWRLIVINDCAPEPEVSAWLAQAAAADSRIILLHNVENLGFVATVNRGMSQDSHNDVLLLNSDTEVAGNWLDRLRAAAYHGERVASVTPFSNNATICSYPRFFEGNALPPGYDTARLDALFARVNARQAVDVPTGVGFCMYIRRDSLDAVGLFDVDEFGKGYGEENDFCCRAAAAGWRHLHALDVFVLHTGGVSFGASKSERERDAMEKLRQLHPSYEPEVHRFVALDPARAARLAVDAARVREAGKPKILAVLHDGGGGTQRHVVELAEHLRDKAVMLSLTPAPSECVVLQLLEPRAGFRLKFSVQQQWQELLQCLRGLGVIHVHYHHLQGHTTHVWSLGEQLGTAWDFTAHDFHAMCPQTMLTGTNTRYCGEDGTGNCSSYCGAETQHQMQSEAAIIAWRARYGDLLTRARYVLTPSRDTAQRFTRMWPAADVHFVPHTDISNPAALPTPRVAPRPATARLRVAILGGISRHKGADVLENVATLAAASPDTMVEFHVIGQAYRELRKLPGAALTVHGQYQESQLGGLLASLQPDVVWFPSLCPETYSYTLSACLAAGLPVIAPDLGAFAERLSGRRWSWIMPWDTPPAAWLAFFASIRTRHFTRGRSPPRHWHVATGLDGAKPLGPWSYEVDYLAGLQADQPGAAPPPAYFAALTWSTLNDTAEAPIVPRSAVHRFKNPVSDDELFTMDRALIDYATDDLRANKYSGVAFYAYKNPHGAVISPVYGFYNVLNDAHFYTIAELEKDSLLQHLPEYVLEGITCYAQQTKVPGDTACPVYRFYSATRRMHFFTMLEAEKDMVIATLKQWSYEGIAFYAWTSESNAG